MAELDAAAWLAPLYLKRHPRPLLNPKALRCLIRYRGQPFYISRQHPAPSYIVRLLNPFHKKNALDASTIGRQWRKVIAEYKR